MSPLATRMIMQFIISILLLLVLLTPLFAQTLPISEKLADTAMNRIWVDERNQPGIPPKWTYEQGVVLKAIEQMWYATGDPKYFRHIQKGMDYWIDEKGNHKDYELEEYNIDHITPGLAAEDKCANGERDGRSERCGAHPERYGLLDR